MEFSSEYTGMLLCYILGPSVVKYRILTTFQAMTTLVAMVINRVPIFSDSVSVGTDWNGIGNGSNFFIGPITDIAILDLYLSAFIKGL